MKALIFINHDHLKILNVSYEILLFTKFCFIINFQNEKVNSYRGLNIHFNPQAPVAPKITDEVLFRRFLGEGVEFFLNRTGKISLIPREFFPSTHLHVIAHCIK